MGLFDKAKKAAQQAQQAFAQPQQGDGMVHVKGAGPIDTAMFGGPSTKSVAADDPMAAHQRNFAAGLRRPCSGCAGPRCH